TEGNQRCRNLKRPSLGARLAANRRRARTLRVFRFAKAITSTFWSIGYWRDSTMPSDQTAGLKIRLWPMWARIDYVRAPRRRSGFLALRTQIAFKLTRQLWRR